MRKILLAVFVVIISFHNANAQKDQQLTKESIVKDTLGNLISYDLWSRLMITGYYKVKKKDKENDEFIIYRLTDEEYVKNFESMPKPKESNYFRTGKSFTHFKSSDINGNKINTKDLAGKIIVLNFWFINCPPCIMEMPELNKIADTYRSDSSVVFIAVALDKKNDLEEFFKQNKFKYMVIDNGRYIADQYSIRSYPTNVIVDPEGKVHFHTTGLAINTAYWLRKSISQLKEKLENKVASSH
jgi:thiol-disulfide isomerase/thioredoxin